MSKRLICAHCEGSGKTNMDCCAKAAGITPSFWGNNYVRCCACKGSGYEPEPIMRPF